MDEYLSFVDESGDPSFNENASKSFFICATIFKKDYQEKVKETLNHIKLRYGFNELKSSRISSDKRRSEILQELNKLDLKVFSIYVNKDSLNGEWFRFRKTFYKYIQGRLISEVFRVFGNTHVTFDSFGKEEYQQSFKKYIDTTLQAELFNPQVVISTPRIDDYLQLSDFIGGSLRKYYEGSYPEATSELENIWKGKQRIQGERSEFESLITNSENDDQVSKIAFESIDRYFAKTINQDEKESHRNVLEFLRQIAIDEPNKFCYRAEIVEWLKYLGIAISEENLSRSIISDLRDDNVLLISSSDGLKIPMSFHEIHEHYNFVLGQAMPSLKRLKKLDQVIAARMESKHEELMKNMDSDVSGILNQIHSF